MTLNLTAGSWIDGYQAVSPAPVEFIRGERSRAIDGHLINGTWSDPWWMYDPDLGWAVARRWRSKETRRREGWGADSRVIEFPARDERVVTPWTPGEQVAS